MDAEIAHIDQQNAALDRRIAHERWAIDREQRMQPQDQEHRDRTQMISAEGEYRRALIEAEGWSERGDFGRAQLAAEWARKQAALYEDAKRRLEGK